MNHLSNASLTISVGCGSHDWYNRVAIDSLGSTQSRRLPMKMLTVFPSPYSSHRYDYCFWLSTIAELDWWTELVN